MDIYDYEPWSGAVYTYERIAREGKLDELDGVLEEVYPEGIDETELNDLLWFEPETVYEWLDMRTETEIREEIEEAEAHLAEISDEIDDLRSDFEYESDEMTEEEAAELWSAEYVGKLVDLEKEAEDVNGEIEKLREELSEL
jgi:hypothetical protein